MNSIRKIRIQSLSLLLLLFTLLFNQTVGRAENMDVVYYPIKPTVILLLRDQTRIENADNWTSVINAALPDSERSNDLSELGIWEIIVIIDEGDYWAVSMHEKGNGMLSKKRDGIGLGDWDIKPRDGDGIVVYVEKKGLATVNTPKGGLDRTPLLWIPVEEKEGL
ncbi:hypothetical protein MLD52_22735 [Puniceicoccaceae bacterium K14]|nr:hypothetical protein [Puniceicoccaceae bacterium K14]